MGHKRITTILTAAVLAVTFSGCGNEPEPEVATPAAAVVEETSAAEPAEGAESTEAAPTTEDTTEDPTTEEAATEEAATEEAPPEEAPTEEAAPVTDRAQEPAPAGDELPTTMKEYAQAFVDAGQSSDQELLERMGTAEALRPLPNWKVGNWQEPHVEERAGRVWLTFLGEGVNALHMEVDADVIEAGGDDGVLSAEVIDVTPAWTPQEYAAELIRMWVEADGAYMSLYATADVEQTLSNEPGEQGWTQTGSAAEGEHVLVTYTHGETGHQLVLTVDVALVERRENQAVVDAEFVD